MRAQKDRPQAEYGTKRFFANHRAVILMETIHRVILHAKDVRLLLGTEAVPRVVRPMLVDTDGLPRV
ncbi:MAG: hypothetical protein B7Z73_12860, partial [Planctomycetia bacterium 21-64-5]